MASTHTTEPAPSKDEQRAAEKQDTKPKSAFDTLVSDIEKFYGVELQGKDYAKLVRDANKVAVERPTGHTNVDAVTEAQYSEKLGRLRDMIERDADTGKATDTQKDLQKYLDDNHVEGVGLSFPTEDSFRITSGGKEDTGHIDVTKEAFLQAVSRIKGGAQL